MEPIYVVTKSDGYYPEGGCHDWVSIHPFKAAAQEAFDKLEMRGSQDAFLVEIRLDEDGFHFENIDSKHVG
jgi:hypothetical protein